MGRYSTITSREALEHARRTGVLGKARLRTLELLHRNQPCSAQRLAAAQGKIGDNEGRGMSGETIRKRITELEELGLAERAGVGYDGGNTRAIIWRVPERCRIPRRYRRKPKPNQIQIVDAAGREKAERAGFARGVRHAASLLTLEAEALERRSRGQAFRGVTSTARAEARTLRRIAAKLSG